MYFKSVAITPKRKAVRKNNQEILYMRSF